MRLEETTWLAFSHALSAQAYVDELFALVSGDGKSQEMAEAAEALAARVWKLVKEAKTPHIVEIVVYGVLFTGALHAAFDASMKGMQARFASRRPAESPDAVDEQEEGN